MIGIPCRELSDLSTPLPTEGVRESYINSILEVGGNPLLIPLARSTESLRRAYDSCDAILLTGGEDVDPKRYGAAPHEKLDAVSSRRDETEILLIKWCVAEKKPLLGLCRGIQVMNVALGGTLYQDIPSERPSSISHQTNEWEAVPHVVTPVSGTRLAEIFGAKELGVNSLHHQAVRDVAPGLVVSATASDGIIEGVEIPGADQFCVGVQWHPETLWQRVDKGWLRLFEAFVHAVSSP